MARQLCLVILLSSVVLAAAIGSSSADQRGSLVRSARNGRKTVENTIFDVDAGGTVETHHEQRQQRGALRAESGSEFVDVNADGSISVVKPVLDAAADSTQGTYKDESTPPKAKKKDAGKKPSAKSREYWKKAKAKRNRGSSVAAFEAWTRRSMGMLNSEALCRLPPSFFAQMMWRQFRAADGYGNQDGCIDLSEHPDAPNFLPGIGYTESGVCGRHIFLYIGSKAFKKDLANIKEFHRGVLKVADNERLHEEDLIYDELQNMSELILDLPVLNGQVNMSNGTDDVFHVVSLNHSDAVQAENSVNELKTQLEAEMDFLKETSSGEFALEEELRVDGDTTIPDSDIAEALENMTHELEDNLTALAKEAAKHKKANGSTLTEVTASGMLQHGKVTDALQIENDRQNSQYWRILSGHCTISNDADNNEGYCIQSPNYPGHYRNNEACSILPRVRMRVKAEAFTTERDHDMVRVGVMKVYHGAQGPQNLIVTPGEAITWQSDSSVTNGGWKICQRHTCLYEREDVCDLRLSQVPLLATHNSLAYPSLKYPCATRKQTCKKWAQEVKQSCDSHERKCKTWTHNMRSQCNGWGTQCAQWAHSWCPWWARWLCGWFCAVTQTVCVGWSYIFSWSCTAYQWACTAFTKVVTYVGCDAFEWVCNAAVTVDEYTSRLLPCLFQNQVHGTTQQLNMGVRFFDFDTCLVVMKMVNCHANNVDLRAISHETDQDIKHIKDWLTLKPQEVVIVSWSDRNDGVPGTDSPLHHASEWHRVKREEVVSKYFAQYAGSRCSSVCFTTNNGMKLVDMIKHNVRLVAFSPKHAYFNAWANIKETWDEPANSKGLDDLWSWTNSFCPKQNPSRPVVFHYYGRFITDAGFEKTGDYTLSCPGHCSPTKTNGAVCECQSTSTGEKEGAVFTMATSAAGLSSLAELSADDHSKVALRDNSSIIVVAGMAAVGAAWGIAAAGAGIAIAGTAAGAAGIYANHVCSQSIAEKVNSHVPTKVLPALQNCLDMGKDVQAIMVDWVDQSHDGVHNVVQQAITKVVQWKMTHPEYTR